MPWNADALQVQPCPWRLEKLADAYHRSPTLTPFDPTTIRYDVNNQTALLSHPAQQLKFHISMVSQRLHLPSSPHVMFDALSQKPITPPVHKRSINERIIISSEVEPEHTIPPREEIWTIDIDLLG
ncbi:hypothetical protein ABVK25_005014 [Lepraria finkii]|uniref:Uncharacterized protein n=1 Tax=Lepraria finkii TaxID=1340010 RepID=A0ABR4BA66_9LECA